MVRGAGVEIWFSVLGSKLAGFVLGSLEAQLFDRSLIWEKSTGWPSTCWGFNKSLFYLEYLLVHLEPSNCKAVLFVSFFFFCYFPYYFTYLSSVFRFSIQDKVICARVN